MGQTMSSSQFFLHGRSHFTSKGWVASQSKYKEPKLLDTADLSDKVFMVTGANSGIGREVAEYLCGKGGTVYMVCRNKERAERARTEILERQKPPEPGKLRLLIGDCSLKRDVSRVAEEFDRLETKLDALVCNAGALVESKTVTNEGIEQTFAGHLLIGSFFLTKLMGTHLAKAPQPRAILVSSGGMLNTPFPRWEIATATDKKFDKAGAFNGQMAYAYAKRGQVLLAEQWANGIDGHGNVKVVSCHPGWVDTPGVEAAFGEKKKWLEPMRTPWQGSEGICWLAVVDAEQIEGGAFYLDRSPQRKHMAGPFFTDGTFTKNTPAQVTEMMAKLRETVDNL